MIYELLGFVNKKYFMKQNERGASPLFREEDFEREGRTVPGREGFKGGVK